MHTHTKIFRESVTPTQAIELLKEGNQRFLNNIKRHRDNLQLVNETKDEQHPVAVVLSCIDSRTAAELVFDQGLGDIFSIRIAGNIVNDDILASMEFACKIAGAKAIVILGHTNCGAIKGACEDVHLGHLNGLISKIKPAIQECASKDKKDVDLVAEVHVHRMVKEVLTRSTILNQMIQDNEIALVGGMYAIETGEVKFFEAVKA
jgi:carbonic anhydrase